MRSTALRQISPTPTKSGRRALLFAALAVAFAATYFLLTFNRTLNLGDEGYLLYNFTKAADGQIPHRDFYDDYGPASYWVGGTLFALFGAKIIVVRVFVVAMKTAMALLVFLIGRRIVPPLFALIGSALFTLNWGDPLIGPVNVLYAGHFNHCMALLGMLFILRYVDSGRKRRLFAVGACVGLSMLFKFPTAAIDFLGFALFLCLTEHGKRSAASTDVPSGACPQTFTLKLLRALKLSGIVGVGIFYFVYLTRGDITPYTFFLFLLALLLLFGRMLFLEMEALKDIRQETRGAHWNSLKSIYIELAIMAVAPAALVLLTMAYYAFRGGLPDLIYGTIALPTHLKFHFTMPNQRMFAVLAGALAAVTLLAVGIGKKLKGRKEIERKAFAVMVSLALILALIAGFSAGTSYRLWHGLASFVILPAALLVGGCLFLVRLSVPGRPGEDEAGYPGLGLIFIFACQSSLIIFLRADETHVTLNSTVIFVLIAFMLKELCEALKRLLPAWNPLPAAASALACLALISVPYVWGMVILLTPAYAQEARAARGEPSYPALRPDAPRAKGLRLSVGASFTPPLHHPIFLDMNEVVNFIRKRTSPEEKIFLMCGDQIIYFLSERESPIQKENYFIYLSNVELIDATDTGRVSDGEILAGLASAMPRFIIKSPRFADTVHFSKTWPKTDEFIRTAYKIDTVIGEYQILRPRGSPPSSLQGLSRKAPAALSTPIPARRRTTPPRR